MTTEFNKSEQHTIVFLLFKTMKYPLRLSLSLILILGGFVLQFYQYESMPGVFLVLVGNLFLLVKGYDNRLKMGKYNPYVKWESISRENVNNLQKMHKKIISWDRSALDITNVLGFWFFFMLSLVIIYLLINGSSYINKSYPILALDIVVLILPHWFTGVRKILTMPVLIMKINIFNSVLNIFSEKLKDLNSNYLIQLRGEKKSKTLPHDIKLRVTTTDANENFLGMYAQISVNDVNGKKYPYFYVVLVANPEFELKSKTQSYKPPKGLIKEYTVQKDVDVLIVRQFTTYTSGYFTKNTVINTIFEEGLGLINLLNKNTH